MFPRSPAWRRRWGTRLLEALRPQGVSVDLRHLDPEQIALLSVRGESPPSRISGMRNPTPPGIISGEERASSSSVHASPKTALGWLAGRSPGGPGWGRSSFSFLSLPTIDQTIV
jgi:hypothetical protein